MDPALALRTMTRAELDTLVDWAAREGWNPGLDDASIFWDTDPEGFVAAELGGELVGGGSIVAYGERFGFMGFFIVRPEHRSHGLGQRLWRHRRDRLLARLASPATIGMDGVFAMQDFYARGGFSLSHRDLRFEALGTAGSRAPGLIDVRELPFDALSRYDAAHFPAPRERFLKAWIAQPNGHGLAVVEGSAVRGYGVIRRCRQGHKIGPLFADDADAADALFRSLIAFAPGEAVYLDVPENNPHAMALARRHGMQEVFGCARMYHGPAPWLPHEQTYGVTTFELG
jgi:ribosomal protein S18 acetylase RimI-like enzyme